MPGLYKLRFIPSSQSPFAANFSLQNLAITPQMIQICSQLLPKIDEEQDWFTGGFLTGLIRQSFKQGYNDFTIKLDEPLRAEFSGLGGEKDNYLRVRIEGDWGIGRAQYCDMTCNADVFYLPDARDSIFTVNAQRVRLHANNRTKGHEVKNVILKSKRLDFLQKVLDFYQEREIACFNGGMDYGPSYSNFKLIFIDGLEEKEICTLNSGDPTSLWMLNRDIFPEVREAERCFDQPAVENAIGQYKNIWNNSRNPVRTALKIVAYETRNSDAVTEAATCLYGNSTQKIAETFAAIAHETKSGECITAVASSVRTLNVNSDFVSALGCLSFIARQIKDVSAIQAAAHCFELYAGTNRVGEIINDFYQAKTVQKLQERVDHYMNDKIKAGKK